MLLSMVGAWAVLERVSGRNGTGIRPDCPHRDEAGGCLMALGVRLPAGWKALVYGRLSPDGWTQSLVVGQRLVWLVVMMLLLLLLGCLEASVEKSRIGLRMCDGAVL